MSLKGFLPTKPSSHSELNYECDKSGNVDLTPGNFRPYNVAISFWLVKKKLLAGKFFWEFPTPVQKYMVSYFFLTAFQSLKIIVF